jgi:dUTP pyrophosphatase
MINVKLLRPTATMPTRSFRSAGYDLYASESMICEAGQITVVPTGIATALPRGHVGLVWDRSGMGKKGLHVFGGVVDEDYRGEWFVMLFNSTNRAYEIKQGDRIAQFLIQRIIQTNLKEVDDLDDTDRGDGGFGSTGR